MLEKNDIRERTELVDAQFNSLFTQFQKNKRIKPNYIQSDGFKDLKIIFELYSETFHLKGYNYNSLSIDKIKRITIGFDCFQKRELIQYLIKTLAKKGNEDEAKKWGTIYITTAILKATPPDARYHNFWHKFNFSKKFSYCL